MGTEEVIENLGDVAADLVETTDLAEAIMPEPSEVSVNDLPGVMGGPAAKEIPPTAETAEAPLPLSEDGVIEENPEADDASPLEIAKSDKLWDTDALKKIAAKKAAEFAKNPKKQAEALSGIAGIMEEQAMNIREKVVSGKGAYGELGRMWAKLSEKEQNGILTEGLGFISRMLKVAKNPLASSNLQTAKNVKNAVTRSIGGKVPFLKYFMVRMSKFSTEELQAYAALGVLKCKDPSMAAKLDKAAGSQLWLASKAAQLLAMYTGAAAATPAIGMAEKAGKELTAQLPIIRANVLNAFPDPEIKPGMLKKATDATINTAKNAVGAVINNTHAKEEKVMKKAAKEDVMK